METLTHSRLCRFLYIHSIVLLIVVVQKQKWFEIKIYTQVSIHSIEIKDLFLKNFDQTYMQKIKIAFNLFFQKRRDS